MDEMAGFSILARGSQGETLNSALLPPMVSVLAYKVGWMGSNKMEEYLYLQVADMEDCTLFCFGFWTVYV